MPATKGISHQQILKVFDAAKAPFLSASDIAAELDVSAETARYHLSQMADEDLVGRKKIGSRAVGWWAKVAPQLSQDVRERAAETAGEYERGETTSHAALRKELQS